MVITLTHGQQVAKQRAPLELMPLWVTQFTKNINPSMIHLRQGRYPSEEATA